MKYVKRKKQLLESLIKKRENASISNILSGDSILSEEEIVDELIKEVLSKYREK